MFSRDHFRSVKQACSEKEIRFLEISLSDLLLVQMMISHYYSRRLAETKATRNIQRINVYVVVVVVVVKHIEPIPRLRTQ